MQQQSQAASDTHAFKVMQRPQTDTDLLALEDVLVELLLQALVGQVDAQLLEGVLLEALKAVDVQNADHPVAALPRACTFTHALVIYSAVCFLAHKPRLKQCQVGLTALTSTMSCRQAERCCASARTVSHEL